MTGAILGAGAAFAGLYALALRKVFKKCTCGCEA